MLAEVTLEFSLFLYLSIQGCCARRMLSAHVTEIPFPFLPLQVNAVPRSALGFLQHSAANLGAVWRVHK